MVPLIILFGAAALIGAGLLFYAQKEQKPKQARSFTNERIAHIEQIYNIKSIYQGVIKLKDICLVLAKIEGVNFSVMSEDEQNSRESALIEIFTGLNYPVRFISSVIVADTSSEAHRVAQIAASTPEGNLNTYRTLYAGMLEMMRQERRILSQHIYMMVPGKTGEEASERLTLLGAALRERASLVITPIESTDEIYKILQDILMPDKIVSPAEIAVTGVTNPIHYTVKEAESFVAKARA